MLAKPRLTVQLLVVVAIAGLAAAARAGEPADRGVSFGAWAGAAVDRSVTRTDDGRPLHDQTLTIGVSGVGNLGPLAIGAAVDGKPAIFGDGRLSLSALLGWQPQVGAMRLQLLGEAGGHRFSDVGGRLFARQLGPDTWLPYAGVRLGVARTVPVHGVFELGAWLFGRYDFGQKTVTNVSGFLGPETRTDYQVGGFMAGLALAVGLRLESSHPDRWEETVAAR